MTVYVDNARIPAVVGNVRGRWSHLTADTPTELHAFAVEVLGLRREWYQGRCRDMRCPALAGSCVHYHYDVTDGKRLEALTAGAKDIDIRALGALVRARRAALRQKAGGRG